MGPTERFSTRAGYYARYRPRYPEAVVDTLESEAGLRPGSMLADIGAGTGISAELFLRRGYAVTAIEPNAEMRAKAIAALSANPAFRALPGTAEQTNLPAQSIDLVLCAQAFHWFRLQETKQEFRRILKPGGLIAILWNLRRRDASPLMAALEDLLFEYCPSYAEHIFKDHEEAITNVEQLSPEVQARTFDWVDTLDRLAFLGRMLSASYVPLEGAPNHSALFAGLNRLIETHARHGQLDIVYQTRLFWTR